MSYQKTRHTISRLESAAAEVLSAARVDAPAQIVATAGAIVQLDSGDHVWLACVPNDDPDTQHIEFLTVAIAVDPASDTIRRKPNGQPIAIVTARGVWPSVVATHGITQIRKACMMIALGEPQPQAEGSDIIALPDADSASASIRSQLAVADQISADLEDAL